MRTLHVLSSIDPQTGGPAAGLNAIIPKLASLGDKTEVVCLDSATAPYIRLFCGLVHALGPARLSFQYSNALREWMVQNLRRFDTVVVHGLWQFHGFCTRAACREVGLPYAVFCHGMLDPWFKRRYPLKHIKKWLYWPWGEYRVLRDAAAVLFTCEEERRLARDSFWLYKADERVVNFGTSRPQGDPAQQRETFLNAFPELRGKRAILFFGRLHEKKGCDLLIRAFSELGDKLDLHHLRLVLAGPCADESYLERLKKLVSDSCSPSSVLFPGMLCGDLKFGAFHAADVFVLPSHQENFGIAIAEAMACGLPVLISNKVNIWREIEQDQAGLIAEDTLAGTGDLLRRWLALTSEMRQKMRVSAKTCFDQRFEATQAAQCLHNVLYHLMESRKHVPCDGNDA